MVWCGVIGTSGGVRRRRRRHGGAPIKQEPHLGCEEQVPHLECGERLRSSTSSLNRELVVLCVCVCVCVVWCGVVRGRSGEDGMAVSL